MKPEVSTVLFRLSKGMVIVLDVFISHSSKDHGLAEDVTDLIRNTIELMGEVAVLAFTGPEWQLGAGSQIGRYRKIATYSS